MKITILPDSVAIAGQDPKEQRVEPVSMTDFIKRLGPQGSDCGPLIVPDGVRAVSTSPCGCVSVAVHETPPMVHSVRWHTDGNKADATHDKEDHRYKIAMPYVLLLPTFYKYNGWVASKVFCYFRNEPLASINYELLTPHLMNVVNDEGNLISACIELPFGRDPDLNSKIRSTVALIVKTFFSYGFNGDMAGCCFNKYNNNGQSDMRVRTIEQWEKSTKADPSFATNVPWIKTGDSLATVMSNACKHQHRYFIGRMGGCEMNYHRMEKVLHYKG